MSESDDAPACGEPLCIEHGRGTVGCPRDTPRTDGGAVVDDLDEQPIPSDAACPKCGGEPMSEEVLHRLSNLGYLHDDIGLKCSERDCGHEWTAGVPIGEFDRDDMAADLWCDSCDKEWMLVHRVEFAPSGLPGNPPTALHLKCPNPDCYNWDRVGREADDEHIALVGYPQITGATKDADPYGYRADQE